jgi:hypothetical protein
MAEPKDDVVSKFDHKLHKLIKRAKKQKGMLWPPSCRSWSLPAPT